MDVFESVCLKILPNNIESLNALYEIQFSIIKHLKEHRTKSNISHLHDAFVFLESESIIDKFALEKLCTLFDPSGFIQEPHKNETTQTLQTDYIIQKNTILSDISKLKKLIDDSTELDKVEKNLNKQSFCIGITGVMNSGKSTMLNALMGKEILGTNVVPETANLTILKYSQKSYAKVLFWNKSQWEEIERSALTINSIDKFVKQTKKSFGDEFFKYILPTSKTQDIRIEQLSEYTSANQDTPKCNLVQHVELFTPLEFLKNNIEIVDTPGLDDIVVQREEITKDYLAKCDILIHLMNVSQSATQKDIEFIIDAVLYQNISKLLIVITRIDMVTETDVLEVIKYTKQSIAKKLNELKSSSKLDFILKTLEFIPISATMALLHKIGRAEEAIKAGYTLERTGIQDVQNYLHTTLFKSKNSRSELILLSAKENINRVLQKTIQDLEYENSLLFKTKDEIDKELKILQESKTKKLLEFKNLKTQIALHEEESSTYIEKLQIFLKNELKELQNILKQRVVDEVIYTLQKTKKAPLFQDINRIIQDAIRHGLVDVIRDYRYKFIQKASKVYELITLEYEDIVAFDESIFEKTFQQGFLTTNNEVLVKKVSSITNKASLNSILQLDKEISLVIKDEFIHLEKKIKQKALEVSNILLSEFFKSLKEPILSFEKELFANEQLLQQRVKAIDENEKMKNEKAMQLYQQIQTIQLISLGYKG